MSSIVSGFEYDIFISYRQKDNKGERWVTEFVNALKSELESTFKEDVSIYFDENPHDGLLETHDVDDSLKDKLKCLIFIPIISQTYCDPKSFAWKNEFLAFKKTAVEDIFGLKVKLLSGNVASRVLPIRIHEIDSTDQKLLEDELQGKLRAIDFIYHSAGVNRPLTPKDERELNHNKIFYRDQINKVANSVKEIIAGLQAPKKVTEVTATDVNSQPKPSLSKKSKWLTIAAFLLLALLAGFWFYNRRATPVISQSIRESRIAVLPFENKTNDAELDMLGDMAADFITNGLMGLEGIKVVTFQSAKENIKLASLSAGYVNPDFAQRTGAETIVKGKFYKNGEELISQVQITDALTGEVLMVMPELKGEISDPYKLVTELRDRMLTAFALRRASVTNILSSKANPPKLEAYRTFDEAMRYYMKDWNRCNGLLKKAISGDSTFVIAQVFLGYSYYLNSEANRADSLIRQIDSRFPNLYGYESLVLAQLKAEIHGPLEQAYQQTKVGFRKDPKDFFFNLQMGVFAVLTKRPSEAINVFRQIDLSALDFSKPLQVFHANTYSRVLIQLNKTDEAKNILQAIPLEMRSSYTNDILAYVNVLENQAVALDEWIGDLESKGRDKEELAYICSYISYWWAVQKENESKVKWAMKALDYLEQSDSREGYEWGQALYLSGQLQKALIAFEGIKKPDEGILSVMGCINAKLGNVDKARRMILEIGELSKKNLHLDSTLSHKAWTEYAQARIWSALGEKEKAMTLLKQAFADGAGFFLNSYDGDLELINLHDYPPFQEFVKPKG